MKYQEERDMRVVIVEPGDLDRVIGTKALWFGMLRLRKKVFQDILKWKVIVNTAGLEYDRFDTADDEPVYVVIAECEDVIGSLRLLPTTGKTMLSEVFRDTMRGSPICDPHIWECSRVCYEPSTNLRQLQVSLKLIEGVREVARRHDIRTLIGNFDDRMLALYRRAGFAFETIGNSDVFGPTVHLGRFDISPEVLTRVEATLSGYVEKLQSYELAT